MGQVPWVDPGLDTRALAVPDELLRAALDALPLYVFIVDEDVRIHYMNAEAATLFEREGDVALRRLGHALHCIHEDDSAEGCGRGPACRDCYVRNAVESCLALGRPLREKTRLERTTARGVVGGDYAVAASPLKLGGRELALLVLQDISELAALREIVPICAWCRRVRSSPDYWQSVEKFASEHLSVDWSHGICDDCRARLAPPRADPT